ncbi:MAG TPA: hypothetical protein VER14_08675, partial [Phototrophicaceae bacterium]|nr:hypothetical protein [Phototrophicaceae bacterium]
HESKDEFKAIVSFAFIAVLLVSSVALSSINMDAFAQAPEVNHTEKESKTGTTEDSGADGLSTEDEGNQPINIDDAMQEVPTADVAEDNGNADETQLNEPSPFQVDEKGNTTIPQDADNTISLLKQETAQLAGNATQGDVVVISPTKNAIPPFANQTTLGNFTDKNMTISNLKSNKDNFIVSVKVTNNSPKNDQGNIHVRIDGGAESKTASAQFPAKKTITKTFQFKASDVPVGKGFTVEVEPEKSNSVTGQGVNSPAKKPEEVKLTIGQSSEGSGKFRVIVKVTNTAATDYDGGVYVDIDGGPSQTQYDITFPAKKTIQRTFEFDSKDVPVGKGFTAEVRWDDDYDTSVNGVNSPKKGPETAEIRIP